MAGPSTREQGQEEMVAHPVYPEQEEEGRALQKGSGLQREMLEVFLNIYILLWQPRKDAT